MMSVVHVASILATEESITYLKETFRLCGVQLLLPPGSSPLMSFTQPLMLSSLCSSPSSHTHNLVAFPRMASVSAYCASRHCEGILLSSFIACKITSTVK